MPRDDAADSSAEPEVTTPNFTIEDADEDELPLEQQLELEGKRIIDRAEGRSAQSKRTSDSEKSERKAPEDDEELSARERQILALAETRAENRALRERLAQLEQRREEATEEDVDETVNQMVGEVDDSLDAIKPTLQRMGKLQVERQRALERSLQETNVRLQTRIDQLEALTVKRALNITRSEEQELIEWARKNERIYTNADELEKIVLDFREKKELEELRAAKADRERSRSPERQANTRQRQGTRRMAEDIEDLKGVDPFTRSWNKAVREKLSDLKAGRFN